MVLENWEIRRRVLVAFFMIPLYVEPPHDNCPCIHKWEWNMHEQLLRICSPINSYRDAAGPLDEPRIPGTGYLYVHHRLRCPFGYRVFLLTIAPPVSGLERLSLALLPKQFSYRRTNKDEGR